jgi:hypothetical protein
MKQQCHIFIYLPKIVKNHLIFKKKNDSNPTRNNKVLHDRNYSKSARIFEILN